MSNNNITETTNNNNTMNTVINMRNNGGDDTTSMIPQNEIPAASNNITQNNTQQIIYNWKELPFDPTDKRPFIRKPTGNLRTPCGLSGVKFAAPWPWLWMIPAIFVPTVVFCLCVPPPDEIWSRVTVGLWALLSYTIYFLGNFVDPAIVPPARVGDPPANPIVIHIDDVGEVQLEVCRTCKILRPPRSSHCHEADVCVRDYDHYCGVLNHVVAKKTFRWFTHFMWVTLLLTWFMTARTLYAAAKEFDYEGMFGTNWGRFRLFGSFGNLMFFCLATCWLGGVGSLYCCYFGGRSLTLKDLKGRKSFVNAKSASWSPVNIWYRLFSCQDEHFPDSVFHDGMTWVEENKATGKMKLIGVNGIIEEEYTHQTNGDGVVL